MYHTLRNYVNWNKSFRTVYSNLTYCSSYILAVETTMVWYVVFHGWKPGVYELWKVCSEYVVDFSGATFQSYSTRMQTEEAYQAFLEHIIEKREHVSNKWYWKDWMILVQFVVIVVLLYKIMRLVCLWL
jgi:viroplasmin and RNaseH domain-containing protein